MFHLCPDTHSWSPSCLLGAAQPGLGVLGDQLFQDARRCQVLFEPPFLSILPDLGGSCAGRNPRRPALGPPGAMEPAGPRLSSVGHRKHTQATTLPPVPSAQLSRHYPPPPGPVMPREQAVPSGEAPAPTFLNPPPRAVPYPSWVTHGEKCPLLLPPWGMEDGVGSPRVPLTPCISV